MLVIIFKPFIKGYDKLGCEIKEIKWYKQNRWYQTKELFHIVKPLLVDLMFNVITTIYQNKVHKTRHYT